MEIELDTSNPDFILVNGNKIYVDEQLRQPILREHELNKMGSAISQFASIPKLPGFSAAIGLPDFHVGYALPIGSIAVVDLSHPEACVSPDGVGFDINCGVRCLRTNLSVEDLSDEKRNELADLLVRAIPFEAESCPTSGKSISHINSILDRGMEYLLELGMVTKDDIDCTESHGSLPGNSRLVGQASKARGISQLGTLGSGNHYLEIQVVEKIFDERIARSMGISTNQVLVSIHTGSRGLGHGCCSSILKEIKEAPKVRREQFRKSRESSLLIKHPSREEKPAECAKPEAATEASPKCQSNEGSLESIPYNSEIGQKYMSIMYSASNFAWANRSIITDRVRKCFAELFPGCKLEMVYDVCHNIAKVEDLQRGRVLVHRKGASRVLPPDHPELPDRYAKTGQPVLVGGSMGTCSYLITGASGCSKTYFSTCHGAGRLVSRSQSRKMFKYQDILEDMRRKNIVFRSGSEEGMIEECCGCYKDVDAVVRHSEDVGITKTVCRVKPLLVIKG